MTNADVLKALFPIPLGSVHEADDAVAGAYLDAAQASADALAAEIFPDTAILTLSLWERTLGINPTDPANVEARRNAIVAMLRATGGLTRVYFTALAAALGYAIEITEPQPFQAGRSVAGDMVTIDAIRHCWGVGIPGGLPPVAYFRAGASMAGDRLGAFPVLDIVALMNRLKPAHTCVYFYDSEEA